MCSLSSTASPIFRFFGLDESAVKFRLSESVTVGDVDGEPLSIPSAFLSLPEVEIESFRGVVIVDTVSSSFFVHRREKWGPGDRASLLSSI